METALESFIKEAMDVCTKHANRLRGGKAVSNPQGYIDSLQAKLEAKFDETLIRVSPEDLMKSLSGILSSANVSDILRQVHFAVSQFRSEYARNEFFDIYYSLIKSAHTQVPYAPLLIFNQHFDVDNHFRKCLEPVDLFEISEKSRGEARARFLLRGMREVVDLLYEKYLRITLAIYHLTENKVNYFHKEKFGQLAKQAEGMKEPFFELQIPELRILRNGASHGNWKYDTSSNKISVWNKNEPKLSISPTDLRGIAVKTYILSTKTIQDAFNLYVFESLLNEDGAMDILFDFSIFEPNNLKAQEEHAAKAEAFYQRIFKSSLDRLQPFV